MRVARFYSPGDIRLEDAPEPWPAPDEVKIRVRNCSTCGTDVKIFNHGHQNLTPPRVIGHEIAGEVVEAGSDVDGWVAGDRVQVIAAVPCGVCYECKRGRMTVCPNQTSVGYQYDGGFAEFLAVPAAVLRVDGLNRIPDGVNPFHTCRRKSDNRFVTLSFSESFPKTNVTDAGNTASPGW